MNTENIAAFAALLQNAKSAVFFGGAGVSTESGLKDYRSEDGLYNVTSKYGVSPETILSRSFFLRNPDVFYQFYHEYFLSQQALPNVAHKTLAKWEQEERLAAVVTQNIDGLHQAAGSKTVFELHGTVYRHHCDRCGRDFPTEQVKALGGNVPYCDCGGLVHPNVVLYEEGLDQATVEGAVNAIERADLLIIGGTSLAVYPAASFLRYHGGRDIVLINKGETPYDTRASLVFRDSIGQVLAAADEAMTK